jgi:hypothetical protein
MKKTFLIVASLLVLSLNCVWAADAARLLSKHSTFLTAQVGLNTLVRTADPFAEPFNTLPFPFGAGLEVMVTGHLGVGGTLMYDQWSDYLGMLGGKWTFRLFRPSLDCAYHLAKQTDRGLDLFMGAQLGYTFISINNNLGNDYDGSLGGAVHLAPFVGLRLDPWPNSGGVLGRLSVIFRAAYSLTGRFSGVYGMGGLTCRLK